MFTVSDSQCHINNRENKWELDYPMSKTPDVFMSKVYWDTYRGSIKSETKSKHFYLPVSLQGFTYLSTSRQDSNNIKTFSRAP